MSDLMQGSTARSLIQSAKLNGHDPYAYLKDVLTRLPTQRASEIDQLLPYQWVSTRVMHRDFGVRLRIGHVKLKSCCLINGNPVSYGRRDARTDNFGSE